MIDKEAFAARAANASPLELLRINYELTILNLREAVAALAANDANNFKTRAENAREYLNVLISSLDLSFDISRELLRVYIFINGLILKAEASKDAAPLREAADMLGKLLDSYKAIPDTEDAIDRVVPAAQLVYAGLTYKDGKLSEYIEEDTDRGFKA